MIDPAEVVVLVVDDDDRARSVAARVLTRAGYVVCEAATTQDARTAMAAVACQLVLCDVEMPGESGLDLAAELQPQVPGVAVVMVSGHDDPTVAAVAVDRGAYGYLVKPYSANELLMATDNALRRRLLELERLATRQHLEAVVAERTRELEAALEEVERSQLEVIRRLTRAVEERDRDTGHHIERIGELSAHLGAELGLDEDRIALLRLAAPMHDVGKLGVPDAILRKPGALDDAERAEMQRHARIGYDILAGSGIELLDLAATIALTHHERWDGGGYPSGLAGDAIPLEGRIVAVADVFDALTSDRVYRDAMPVERALAIIAEGSGSHFDPRVATLLLELHDGLAQPSPMR